MCIATMPHHFKFKLLFKLTRSNLIYKEKQNAHKCWARTISQGDKQPINDKIGESLYFIKRN
jgi:hypothetical protein